MAKKKLKDGWFDHRTDLPQWLSIGIGQVIVEWAVLERELEEVVRLLMDADIAVGRIVTKLDAGPRLSRQERHGRRTGQLR